MGGCLPISRVARLCCGCDRSIEHGGGDSGESISVNVPLHGGVRRREIVAARADFQRHTEQPPLRARGRSNGFCDGEAVLL